MAEDDRPLTEDERAELERLRAEKAARERAERDRADRAELERLRAEREAQRPQGEGAAPQAPARDSAEPERRRARRTVTVTPEEAAQMEHDKEVRARNAKLMEPDDDLNMPIGQKVALVCIFAFAIIAVLAILLGPK